MMQLVTLTAVEQRLSATLVWASPPPKKEEEKNKSPQLQIML